MMLAPDTSQPAIYATEIAPHLAAGKTLMFAHGFNIRFGADQAAGRRRREHDRAQGPRPPRARDSTRPAAASPRSSPSTRTPAGQAKADRALVRARPSAPRARASSRRRSPRRPRPISSASRPCSAAACRALVKAGLRDAGRGRLPARDRVLRVPARAQAHRRPDVPGRPELHALLGQRHRRVRRLHRRPAHRRPTRRAPR